MKRNNLLNLNLIVLLALFTQCAQDQRTDDPIRLTALNSMQRAIPGRPIEGAQVIDIKAAKNEYEAFQVVIEAGNENLLQNVQVSISDLEGESGRIGSDNIILFRAENVHLRNSTDRAYFGPGLFPDPLLPFLDPVSGESIKSYHKIESSSGSQFSGAKYRASPINLYPGQSCTIWVDVYIPSDTKAGIYTGNLKVTTDENISSQIPITLKVWNFTLPQVATHRTHLGHFSHIATAWGIDSHSERFREIEMRFCRELAKHRVNPPIPHSLLPEVNNDGSLTIDPEKQTIH